MLGDRPGGEPRQPDRELAGAFHEPHSKRALGGEPREGGERDEARFLRDPEGIRKAVLRTARLRLSSKVASANPVEIPIR